MIQKIRNEIERLKEYYCITNPYDKRAIRVCETLLSFLSTLESEKPVPADLEEAAKEYCPDDAYPFGPDIINKEVRKAFIAGYNLCKEQTEKMWLEDRDGCFWDGVEEGKKAMKEQMLKEAVEGEIQMRYSGCLCAKTIHAINEDKFKFGDKVKIIIVKED